MVICDSKLPPSWEVPEPGHCNGKSSSINQTPCCFKIARSSQKITVVRTTKLILNQTWKLLKMDSCWVYGRGYGNSYENGLSGRHDPSKSPTIFFVGHQPDQPEQPEQLAFQASPRQGSSPSPPETAPKLHQLEISTRNPIAINGLVLLGTSSPETGDFTMKYGEIWTIWWLYTNSALYIGATTTQCGYWLGGGAVWVKAL